MAQSTAVGASGWLVLAAAEAFWKEKDLSLPRARQVARSPHTRAEWRLAVDVGNFTSRLGALASQSIPMGCTRCTRCPRGVVVAVDVDDGVGRGLPPLAVAWAPSQQATARRIASRSAIPRLGENHTRTHGAIPSRPGEPKARTTSRRGCVGV